MSGICGILNLDGTPIDRQLLQNMTEFMTFRGPDALDTWSAGPVGFGHTLLRTTYESEHEHQPHSLDGQVWITADARIDGQAELRRQLLAMGRTAEAGATDGELILHAYHAWGEGCLQHLIGDFAFAIWDGVQRKLFCARDHFGVKPFFYAQVGHMLVFSNTLECVRIHPAVSGTLNDLWIADFLLFEMSLDGAATAFADIRRLPPSHSLTWSEKGLSIKRYWSLPTDLGIRYRPEGDYVEHFKMLLEQAVADRLRTDRVGIEMSGGMDSTSVAAVAKDQLSLQLGAFELHAHTVVYDSLFHDEERHYAGLAAEELAIPIHFLAADDYKLFERCDDTSLHSPEPSFNTDAALFADFQQQAAAYSRVVLTGWDGDALLNETPLTWFRALLKQRRYGCLIWDAAKLCLTRPRQVTHAVRNRLRSREKYVGQTKQSFPIWINPDLEKRFQLRQRWNQFQNAAEITHPIRPYAYRSYDFLQRLSNFFDDFDAGLTKQPLEYRHPLLDLRMIEYCLTLPPLPWCIRKELLRAATKGMLPESVRCRPKTPLAGFPYIERLKKTDSQPTVRFAAATFIYKYVDWGKISPVWAGGDPVDTRSNLRPLSLSFWFCKIIAYEYE